MRLCAIFAFAGLALAQPAPPDTPEAVESAKQPTRADTHIFGVVPNYDSVDDPSHPVEPLIAREKFLIAAHDSFDPFSWLITGIYAGVEQWQNQFPEYGPGARGYAKRYGQSFADGAIADFMTDAIFPAVLHEDPRYFRLGQGSSIRRVGYAMSRVLVTRTDAGGRRFNTSEVAGNMTGAALSNLYSPAADRDLAHTMDKFAVNIVSDAGFNVLREFWPDWRRKFLHK